MKSQFINTLTVGLELLNEPFLLQDMVERKTKDGRPYLLCTLQDRTGQLGAVFWDIPSYIQSWVQVGKIILVTGRVTQYKDVLQINITDLNIGEHYDLRDFVSSSQRSAEEMIHELKTRIQQLAEPWQTLVSHLLLTDDFLPLFAKAPAARTMHHAYIGGLLEHSLSMATLAEMLGYSL